MPILINWIIALSSVVTATVTAIYVFYTRRILLANQAVVALSESQLRAQSRPYMCIRAVTRPASPVFQISIANIGKSTAQNLRLSMTPDLYQFGIREEHKRIQRFDLFTRTTDSFPPGMELVIDVGRSQDFFVDDDKGEPLFPHHFQVVADYSSEAESYRETTSIDFRVFAGVSIGNYGYIKEAEELNRKMDDIKSAARTFEQFLDSTLLKKAMSGLGSSRKNYKPSLSRQR